MTEYFLIYMKLPSKKEGYSKWPVTLYAQLDDKYTSLTTLQEIKDWLILNKKIHYKTEEPEAVHRSMLRSQILTIIGPVLIPLSATIPLSEVYTVNEAARLWGLADSSTIRKSIEKGTFPLNEVKKSDSIWLVTYAGMLKRFGPLNEDKYEKLIVNQVVYDENEAKFKSKYIL